MGHDSLFSGHRAKLLLLLVTTGGVLLLAEMAVRTWFRADVDSDVIRAGNAQPNYLDGMGRPAVNPDRVFEFTPGVYRNWGSVVLVTDADESRRVGGFAPPPESPAVRIALVGDSSAIGFSIDFEVTYGALLENRLAATFDVPVEVRVYGAPGYNAAMHRAVVEGDVAAWKPDLLVLHYDHNDSDAPVSKGIFTDLDAAYGDNVLHSALIKFVMRRFRVSRTKARFQLIDGKDKAESERVDHFRMNGPRYEDHLRELRRIGKSAARQGLPAVAVIFDGVIKRFENPQDDPHYTHLHEPLNAVLSAAGFAVLDLYPQYQELMKERNWADLQPFAVNGVDFIHPNVAGHFFIAKQLHDYIVNDPGLSAAFRRPGIRKMNEEERARVIALDRYQTAIRLLHAGKYGEAEPLFREAVQSNPKDPGTHTHLGFALMFQDNVAEAMDEFNEALRLNADLTFVHFPLGDCYLRQGELLLAVNHLGAVLRHSSSKNVIGAAAPRYIEACTAAAVAISATDRVEAVRLVDLAIQTSRNTGATAKVAELEELRASIQATASPE